MPPGLIGPRSKERGLFLYLKPPHPPEYGFGDRSLPPHSASAP